MSDNSANADKLRRNQLKKRLTKVKNVGTNIKDLKRT